jgi:hypothetical protein
LKEAPEKRPKKTRLKKKAPAKRPLKNRPEFQPETAGSGKPVRRGRSAKKQARLSGFKSVFKPGFKPVFKKYGGR